MANTARKNTDAEARGGAARSSNLQRSSRMPERATFYVHRRGRYLVCGHAAKQHDDEYAYLDNGAPGLRVDDALAVAGQRWKRPSLLICLRMGSLAVRCFRFFRRIAQLANYRCRLPAVLKIQFDRPDAIFVRIHELLQVVQVLVRTPGQQS